MNRTSPHNQLRAASRGGTKSENKALIIHNHPPPCHGESKETIQQNLNDSSRAFSHLLSYFPLSPFILRHLFCPSCSSGITASVFAFVSAAGRQLQFCDAPFSDEQRQSSCVVRRRWFSLSFSRSLFLFVSHHPPLFSMQLTHTLLDLAINSVRFNKRLHLSHCVRQFGGLLLGWRGPTCPENNTRLWPLTCSCFKPHLVKYLFYREMYFHLLKSVSLV